MPEYLPFTEYTVIQPAEQYHFNSDTVLLGLFPVIRHKDSVLDIGCGQGALLLYASLQKPASLTGIDLYPEITETARRNLENNHVQAEIHTVPVQEFTGGPYDVILCNPPYFTTAEDTLKNDNRYLRSARHDDHLPMGDLFAAVRRLLKDKGIFSMVQKAEKLTALIYEAEKHGLYPCVMRIAYDREGGSAKSVLLSFSKSRKRELKILFPAYLDDRSTYQRKDSK